MMNNSKTQKQQPLTAVGLRKRLGLTQVQAAEAIGIRPATLSSWETGRIPQMSPSLVKKL